MKILKPGNTYHTKNKWWWYLKLRCPTCSCEFQLEPFDLLELDLVPGPNFIDTNSTIKVKCPTCKTLLTHSQPKPQPKEPIDPPIFGEGLFGEGSLFESLFGNLNAKEGRRF